GVGAFGRGGPESAGAAAPRSGALTICRIRSRKKRGRGAPPPGICYHRPVRPSGVSVSSLQPVTATDLPGIPRFRTGKVRDVYDLGDTLLIVATDRISAFDYVLGSGIPDKGRVLTQLSAFWFDRLRDIVPNHLITVDVARFPQRLQPYADLLRGRSMLVRRTQPLAIECGARVSLGLGLEGLPGLRRRLRRGAARGAPRVGSAAGADLHAGDEGRVGTRHQHHRSGSRRAAGQRGPAGAPARADAGAVHARRGTRRALRHHPRRHEVRVRPDRRRHAAAHRRGVDARFVAVLAGRPVRTRTAATELRQAVRPRLPRGDRLEQAAAGARAARGRRRAHAREVPRGVRAAHRTAPPGGRPCVSSSNSWWTGWSPAASGSKTDAASSSAGSSNGRSARPTATCRRPPRGSASTATRSPGKWRSCASGGPVDSPEKRPLELAVARFEC